MKTEEFWIPCTFEERRPMLLDRMLFIPEHYDEHEKFELPNWEDSQIFGNSHPVVLEYCSGNGHWILERAEREPNRNWIALERRFDRTRRIWEKLKKANLPNLFIVFGDAETFTKSYLKDSSIDESYMNFPDPWPKTKHAKHRIVQNEFVGDLSRVLKPKSQAVFVTDNEAYSNQMIQVLSQHSNWVSAIESPFYTNDWPDFGSSFFDQLWRDKGCKIRYHRFVNQKVL